MKYQLTIICELDDETWGLSDLDDNESRIQILREDIGIGELFEELKVFHCFPFVSIMVKLSKY